MPTIGMFFGIIVMTGEFPKRQTRLIVEWMELHERRAGVGYVIKPFKP